MPIIKIKSDFIYFSHIPKCAGTSIENYFSNYKHLEYPYSRKNTGYYGLNYLNLQKNRGIYSISQIIWLNAPTFNNLNAGSYLVTVSDSNSCEEQLSVNINQPNILSVNTNISLPNCYNSSDGMIILNPQGGTPSYNYYLNSIQVDSIVSGLSAGNFSLSSDDDDTACEKLIKGLYKINNDFETL